VFFDLYVGAGLKVTPQLRAACALKITGSGAHISHHTAAELWGVWVPSDPRTHVTVSAGQLRPERQGIHAHTRFVQADVTMRHGLSVSTPTQTFLDLAGDLGLVDLVVVGDSMVRHRLATLTDLRAAAAAWRGKGARRARRASALCRDGVDSVMETRLRLLMVLAGLPEPMVNHIIRGPMGEWAIRCDLSYPGVKLIIEYDGRQHAESEVQWQPDIERRESLDRDGWRLIVVRAPGIWVEPGATLRRIVDAMRELGVAGVPGRFSAQWRAHFPGRASS